MEGVSLEISGDTICGAITVNVDMLVNVLQRNGTNKPCVCVCVCVCVSTCLEREMYFKELADTIVQLWRLINPNFAG